MKSILQDRSFRLAIILTFMFLGTGITFLFLGLASYGWMLFILLPIVLGFSVGAMPNRKYTLLGTLLATVIFLVGMYIPGLSGLLCIVMTLPIIVPLIFLGYVLAHLARRYQQIRETNKVPMLLLPLVPFLLASPTEYILTKNQEVAVAVKTERIFDYTPEEVYEAIKSVDTLDAEKPFLMLFDLPVPTKCVLEKEEVGGLRICYFDGGALSNADFGGGTITERITALEKGKVLKMDVVEYTLVGRKWLGFKEAIYYFDPVGEGRCQLTRITTYTSVLTPRLYWEPLEKLGIQQEHDYVFNNLQKDLVKKHGRK